MPDRNTPRRVSSGSTEYRRKGTIKNWETTEICTSDPSEIGRYLRGMDPRTRVWISAYGTVYLYQGRRAIARGTEEHVTLLPNTELRYASSDYANQTVARNRAVFHNPDTDEFDIEYYCVRTRPPRDR